ncbi:MAG TPA: helix-turn-helix domain-containing protein [Thermoleophilaceae bacterium]|nr:helix-turn-helix domain-containing protein [Thermoleophilaceae bacterium]
MGSDDRLPRGSHGLPPEFVVHSQRDRLFAGIARVMARRGYAATTVDEIASESGVSRKALYTHFSGKEDVLLQAHRAVVEQISTGAGSAAAEQDDWRAALRALFDWGLELFAREPALANLALVEIAAATPASRRLQRETLDGIRSLIEQATADSEHAVPDVAIDGMLGGMAYAIAKAAEERDPAELPMLRPQLMAWFMLVFDGPGAAEAELNTPG